MKKPFHGRTAELAELKDITLSNNTGFVGRISWNKTLRELPVSEAVQFWGGRRDRLSAAEQLRLLMITGGVPGYLEDIIPPSHGR